MRSLCCSTPWLFLDASGVAVNAGVWQISRWLGWHKDEAPALEALFAGIETALRQAGLSHAKLGGFIYVEGPGSVLGLRLAAMAIRAWQADDAASARAPRPVISCGSLHLAAAMALAAGTPPPFSVCSEARQGRWHVLSLPQSRSVDFVSLAIVEMSAADLPAGELFYLPARKSWAGPPPNARPLPATLRDHPEVLALPGLCRPTETATPYGSTPIYRKWESSSAAH